MRFARLTGLAIIVWSAIALAGCGIKLPPIHLPSPPSAPTAPVPDPATRAIGAVAIDASTSQPLAGVTVSLTNRDTGRVYACGAEECTTTAAGYAGWPVVPVNTHLVLELHTDGYLAGRYEFTLTESLADVRAPLTPITTPTPPPPARRTRAELLHALANFCNLTDSQGRVVFTPFKISLPTAERAEWYDLERAAGSTHTVLSPTIGYPGSPIPGRDLYDNPLAFREFVIEALNTPAADGKGFAPIIILDAGDEGIRERIDRLWPPIRAALEDVNDDIIVVPGWELIKASAATSADYAYALTKLQQLGFRNIGVHLSPGRASFASHPLEEDDPWAGAESGSWKSAGGEFPVIFFYQSDAVRTGDENCDPAADDCWLNRFEDVVPRIGNGMNGWRSMPLVYFEGPAYYYYRKQTDSAFAVRIADAAQRMCAKYSVPCGYGNGIPSNGGGAPAPTYTFSLSAMPPPAPRPSFTFLPQER